MRVNGSVEPFIHVSSITSDVLRFFDIFVSVEKPQSVVLGVKHVRSI